MNEVMVCCGTETRSIMSLASEAVDQDPYANRFQKRRNKRRLRRNRARVEDDLVELMHAEGMIMSAGTETNSGDKVYTVYNEIDWISILDWLKELIPMLDC